MNIGIQSFDPEVLRTVDRPFNFDRFMGVVRELHHVAEFVGRAELDVARQIARRDRLK